MDAGTHLLYVLLDSNLPTGGFVASSGLESWAKHGFLSFDPDPSPVDGARAAGGSSGSTKTSGDRTGNGGIHENGVPAYGRRPVNPTGAAAGVTDFARAEIENYHSTTGGFVKGAWDAVSLHLAGISTCAPQQTNDSRTPRTATVQDTMQKLLCLDKYHEASMLSHVSRRASKAQGVAMLTLYTKGLSTPTIHGDPTCGTGATVEGTGIGQARELVDAYKWLIRKNVAPGHLAVCWGIMTAALGIPLAIHLHLFLHARSLLSAAVRLNLIGPYLSSQLLLHPFKTIIDRAALAPLDDVHVPPLAAPSDANAGAMPAGNPDRMVEELKAGGGIDVEKGESGRQLECEAATRQEQDPWAWTREAESGPATTWPLGELLMARHDLQHSRIFNS